jgi:hypothetical protein
VSKRAFSFLLVLQETKLIANDYSEGDGGVTGFIAVDNTPGSIALILAFRGVRSIETGITEIDTRLVPAAGCGVGCEVHEGFQESWDSVSARITRELTNAQVATGITTLVVTGHGVGGALATLAATQFRTTIIPGITAGNVRLVSRPISTWIAASKRNG